MNETARERLSLGPSDKPAAVTCGRRRFTAFSAVSRTEAHGG